MNSGLLFLLFREEIVNWIFSKINDIFTKEQLANSVVLESNQMQTGIFINNNGKFKFHALPIEAQFAPVYAIEIFDFDKDGNQDILLGGNFHRAKPEVGSYDGSHGLFLKGNGKG